MFDNLGDNAQRLLVAGIFFFVFVLIAMFLKTFGPSRPAETSPFAEQSTATPEPGISICDTVVMGSCEVQIKEEHIDCSDEKALRDSLTPRVANPKEDKVCKDAELELNERCPKGCFLDYGSLVHIPGKVRFDLFPAEEGIGCEVRLRRSVSMQGSCVEGDTSVPSEPAPIEE